MSDPKTRKVPRPATKDAGARRGGGEAHPGGAGGKPSPLVLIVDDYEDTRALCSELLGFHGFRTEEATTGLEAIEKARALLPAVILMDLSLPGLDGWEATRRLKADSSTRHIPVVAVTGHALVGQSEVATAAGCDSFLTKPVMLDDLMREIRRFVDATPREARAWVETRA